MEIEIVKFVQSWANDFLDVFFWLITKMGEETFFLITLAMIYICYDKFFAIKYSYFYLISAAFNSLFKICARRPRPYVASSEIKNRLPASSYSFPSGHSQCFFVISTTGMIEINSKNKRKKLKLSLLIVFCVLGILLMISRLYWGQHYLSDVVVGMMFGITIPFGLNWLIGILPGKLKEFFTVDKMFLILGIFSAVLFVILLPLELGVGFVSVKAYKFLGVFLAMSIGYFIDKKFIDYKSNQGFLLGLVKFVITIIVLIGLYLLLNLIIPLKGYIYFLVYLFLGLICTIILPLIYKVVFKKVDNEKRNCK